MPRNKRQPFHISRLACCASPRSALVYFIRSALLGLLTAQNAKYGKAVKVIAFALTVHCGGLYAYAEEIAPVAVPEAKASEEAAVPTVVNNENAKEADKKDETVGAAVSGTASGSKENAGSDAAALAAEEVPEEWPSSIMFGADEIKKLQDAIVAGKNRKDNPADAAGAELEQELQQAVPAEQPPAEAPAFYLNSVLYISKTNWAVWVNGDKMDASTTGDVEVKEVGKDYAVVSWDAAQIDQISPGWKEKITTSNISYDAGTKRLNVKLLPNQTFISREMEIVEGKAESSPMNLGEAVKAPGVDEAKVEAPAVPAPQIGAKPEAGGNKDKVGAGLTDPEASEEFTRKLANERDSIPMRLKKGIGVE